MDKLYLGLIRLRFWYWLLVEFKTSLQIMQKLETKEN